MLSNRNYSFRRVPFDSLGKPHHIAIQPLLRQQTRNPFVCHSRRCLPKSLNPVPDWILDRTTPRVSVNQVERAAEGGSDRKGRASQRHRDTRFVWPLSTNGAFVGDVKWHEPVLCRRIRSRSRSSRTFRVLFVAVRHARVYACVQWQGTQRERERGRERERENACPLSNQFERSVHCLPKWSSGESTAGFWLSDQALDRTLKGSVLIKYNSTEAAVSSVNPDEQRMNRHGREMREVKKRETEEREWEREHSRAWRGSPTVPGLRRAFRVCANFRDRSIITSVGSRLCRSTFPSLPPLRELIAKVPGRKLVGRIDAEATFFPLRRESSAEQPSVSTSTFLWGDANQNRRWYSTIALIWQINSVGLSRPEICSSVWFRSYSKFWDPCLLFIKIYEAVNKRCPDAKKLLGDTNDTDTEWLIVSVKGIISKKLKLTFYIRHAETGGFCSKENNRNEIRRRARRAGEERFRSYSAVSKKLSCSCSK